jgi:hypothetical protein
VRPACALTCSCCSGAAGQRRLSTTNVLCTQQHAARMLSCLAVSLWRRHCSRWCAAGSMSRTEGAGATGLRPEVRPPSSVPGSSARMPTCGDIAAGGCKGRELMKAVQGGGGLAALACRCGFGEQTQERTYLGQSFAKSQSPWNEGRKQFRTSFHTPRQEAGLQVVNPLPLQSR